MSEELPVIPVSAIHHQLAATLIEATNDLGQSPEDLVRRILYSRGADSYPMHVTDDRYESLQFVSGHVWGREPRKGSPGPRYRSDVMIVDKAVDRDGLANCRIFSGESGKLLADLLSYAGFEGISKFYVTTLLKTRVPDSALAYKQHWSKDQIHLLWQEIFLVRPKFLLLLGSDVVKAVIGKNVKVTRMENLVHDITFTADGQEPVHVKACVTMRPEALVYARDDYQRKKIIQQLAHFRGVIEGKADVNKRESPVGHVVIDSEADLIRVFKQVREDSIEYSKRLICVDCEWEGDHPQSHGAFLRSIQVSGRIGNAITLAMTWPGGKPRFKVFRRFKKGGKVCVDKTQLVETGATRVVIRHLKGLLKDRRICGHSIKSDLEWLEYYGLDIYEQNLIVPGDPADCKTQGPFCTLLAAHAYDEQAELGLDDQISVHLPHIPAYWAELNDHIDDYCARNKIAKSKLDGYGFLDDGPLYRYANWDVDAGLQLAIFYLRKLDKDNQGNNCWKAYHISINAMYGAYEITKVGFKFNKEEADRLTLKFMIKRAELLKQLQEILCWPDLNMESTDQLRELLFGTQYNGKQGFRRLRPPGAKTLATMPILSTGKYQKNWTDLVDNEEDHKYNVSCNRVVLGLLLLDSERLPVRRRMANGKWTIRRCDGTKLLSLIRDYRLVSQQLKGPLRPPTDPPPSREDWDPDEPYYAKGIPGSVCDDNRVRTTILQTKETGRWSSISPPLMNLCIDSCTEYLTDRGWVPVAEFKSTDKVAQYWPESGQIDFVVPSKIIRQKYTGEMVHLHGEQVDMMMTPNHRHIFKMRRRSTLRRVTAEEIYEGAEWQNIHAGKYVDGTVSLSQAMIQWLVAVQADGSYCHTGSLVFNFVKKRKILRLQQIMQSIGLRYTIQDYAKREYTAIRVPRLGNEAILDVTKDWLPDKQWSNKILTLSQESLRMMCEELPYWDGLYKGKTQYYSSVKSNSDWMQIAWLLTGVRAKLCKYQPSNKKAKTNWQVNIPNVYTDRSQERERFDTTTIKKHKVDRVHYDGYVYCVTVPSSYVVVRRNGMVSVTGNSNAADKQLQKLFGKEYPGSVKLMLEADEDYFLVAADLGGAELRMTAVQSQDTAFIDATERLALKEDHPDHMDIHSSIAVAAFNLPCKPTKSAMEAIGRDDLRTGAKTVIFGKFYGQSIEAAVIAVRQRGTPATYDQMQAISDTFDATYPGVLEYFAQAMNRVFVGFTTSWAGRYRRFPKSDDRSKIKAMQRESLNAGIQGGVADYVSKAIPLALKYRDDNRLDAKLVLQKHDELIFMVHKQDVRQFCMEGVPYFIRDGLCFWSADFDGLRRPGTPDYRFAYDLDVMRTWGRKLKEDELKDLGIEKG